MPDVDLDHRLRTLDRIEAPDLWGEIGSRTPRPVSERRQGGRLLAGAVALVVAGAGIGLAAVAFRGSKTARLSTPVQLSSWEIAFTRETADGPAVYVGPAGGTEARLLLIGREPAWSPDGTRIAFVREVASGGAEIDVVDVATGDVTNLTTLAVPAEVKPSARLEEIHPVWSPDGTRILFRGWAGVFVMNADGSGLTPVTDAFGFVGHSSPTWSPDGTRILYLERDDVGRAILFTADPDGSNRSAIADDQRGQRYPSNPSWSPDGGTIAFAAGPGGGTTDIWLVNADGTDARDITNTPDVSESMPAWSPDGTWIAFSTPNGLRAVHPDGTGMAVLTDDSTDTSPAWNPVPVEQPEPSPSDGRALVAPQNGEIWFRRGGGEGGVWIESIDPDGSNRQVLWSDTYAGGRDDVGVMYDWSPEGTHVAFIDSTRYIGEVPTGSSWDVYTMNADGTGRRQVTDDGAFAAAPSWSPDGARIAFASDRADPDRPACETDVTCNRDVFTMNADGTNAVQLTDEPGSDWQPDWGPDGRIVFVSERDDASGDVYVMNADGTEVTRITATPAQESQPRWSPDGTRIGFVRSDGTSSELYVMDADGSNEKEVGGDLPTSFSVEPDILDSFAWSPDGTMLAFAGGGEGRTTLFVVGADGQGLRILAVEPDYGVSGPAWRPTP